MRVDQGPLTLAELREFGPWIYNACEALPTFTLVNVDEADRILDRGMHGVGEEGVEREGGKEGGWWAVGGSRGGRP